MTAPLTTRAAGFAELEPDVRARWLRFGQGDETLYPSLLGLIVEEVRVDYCRMRLPFATKLLQGGGVVHGGAIASLLDSVVVPAVGSVLDARANYATVDMHVQFIRGIVGGDRAEDAVAEGWVTRRGRTTVFCESEAHGATSGKLLAKSVLTYNVAGNVPAP